MPPMSSASVIGRCAILSGPVQLRLLPSTITSLLSTSIPEEILARGDCMVKSDSSEASVKSSAPISPNASATPKAPAARAYAIDLLGSVVSGVLPAAIAAVARATVTQGHLTWTKCTSSRCSIPAASMAFRTVAATLSTWARRPTSSAGTGALKAVPIARDFSDDVADRVGASLSLMQNRL